jgi:hypothetical protein
MIKYWAYKIFFMVPIALVYYAIASDGLRTLLPSAFAVKIHRMQVPFAFLLEDDEFGYRLDLANVFAAILIGAVCMVWEALADMLIHNDVALAEADPRADSVRKRLFLLLLGPVLLCADACLFFIGVMKHTAFSARGTNVTPALIVTLLYVTVVVTAAYVTANAKHRQ